jgi:hypothetical protein
MATMILRDAVLRARQVEGDPELVQALLGLPPDDSLVLRIEGRPIRFRKMVDREGSAVADGLEPDGADAAFWQALQSRRGAMVTVEAERPRPDPYLLSLGATLTEWNSPEDAAAYDGL